MEFVLVNQLVVSGAQLTDGLVVLVHDGDVAVAVAITSVVVTLKAEQDVLALPAGSLEVGGPDAVDAVAGPDQVPVITEDVRAGLARAMLLAGRVGEPGERGHKEVPLSDVLGGRDADVQPGWRKVSTGAELPVGSGRSEEQTSCGKGGRGPHGGATSRIELGASAAGNPILLNVRYIHLWLVYAPKEKIF